MSKTSDSHAARGRLERLRFELAAARAAVEAAPEASYRTDEATALRARVTELAAAEAEAKARLAELEGVERGRGKTALGCLLVVVGGAGVLALAQSCLHGMLAH